VIDIFVQAEPAVIDRHVAGIVPVGQIDVVIGQQGLHGAAQQRREMAGHRRHQQHPRLAAGPRLAEMQQGRERRRRGRFFFDRDMASVDAHRGDVESGPAVTESAPGHDLPGGPGRAEPRDPAGTLLQSSRQELRHGSTDHSRCQPQRLEHVSGGLVAKVNHAFHSVANRRRHSPMPFVRALGKPSAFRAAQGDGS